MSVWINDQFFDHVLQFEGQDPLCLVSLLHWTWEQFLKPWYRGQISTYQKGGCSDSEVINHDQKEPRADAGTNYRANGSSCDREKYLSLYLGRIAFPPSDWFIRHLYGQILSKWFGSGEAVLITCACCWLTPNTRTHEYRLRIFTPPT